jgi:cupredoxin-like protein
MSTNQRVALVASVVAVAVVAFVIAKPGDNGKSQSQSNTTSVTRIEIKNGRAVGGIKKIVVQKDQPIRIVVSVDKPQPVHLHGYSIEKEIKPGKPATYSFRAKNEGAYEMESHASNQKVAILRVEPR